MATKIEIDKRLCGEKSPHLLFIIPAVIFVGLVLIYPIIYTIVVSFFKWHLVDSSSRAFLGIANYVSLFKDKAFWHSLLLQLGFIFIAIPIELVIGFFVALLLNRDFFGANVIRALLLLPVFVLPVLSGLTWRFMFMPEYGPISYVLTQLGFESPTFLADPILAYMAVIIQDIWRMWPFMFMILYAGLSTIDGALIEAADVDGAKFWNKVFKIYIPILKPTIITALLLRIIDALRIFSEIFVMTNGGPGNATTLFSIYTHRQAFRYFNIGMACTMAIFLIIVSLILASTLVKKHIASHQ